MNKKTWDLYAPIYKLAMKPDEKIYSLMYKRIPKVIKDKKSLKLLRVRDCLQKRLLMPPIL